MILDISVLQPAIWSLSDTTPIVINIDNVTDRERDDVFDQDDQSKITDFFDADRIPQKRLRYKVLMLRKTAFIQ